MNAATRLLADARGATDPEAKRAAQRTLTQLGSLKVARALIGGTDDERLALWRAHASGEALHPAIVPVVLAAIALAPTATVDRALDLARRRKVGTVADPEQRALAELLIARAADLSLRNLLALVEWALEDEATWLRGPGPLTELFTHAAVTALAGVAPRDLAEVRWSGGLQRVLVQAATNGEVAGLVDRWLTDASAAALVTHSWFSVHEQLARKGDATRLVALVSSAWERTDDRARLATALADATARHRSQAGTDGVLDWAWARFCDRPVERPLLYRALRPWRAELIERRNATPRARRPGGASAVEHVQVWGALDPEQLTAVLDEAARLALPADWSGLVAATFAIAEAAVTPGERVWGLVGVGQLGHELRNRLLDRDVTRSPEEQAATTAWRDRAAACAQQLRDDGLVLDRDLANRVEDFDRTVQLIDRERGERAAAAEETRLRDEERARRDAERVRAAADRERLEAERLRAAADRVAHTLAVAGPELQPKLPVEPTDREPFFAALALPTLLDYTRAMARMQRGADVMALFAELGLDATSWSACVQAWSSLFGARPDLAMRFGALLSGGWE